LGVEFLEYNYYHGGDSACNYRNESQQSITCESSVMEVQKDFRDSIELLNAHRMDYLSMGAIRQGGNNHS
jgi:hypothetical protein